MKVRLIKKYRLIRKQLPKNKVVEVSNEKGRDLIRKKVGVEVDGLTTDEETFVDSLPKKSEDE